MKNILLLIESLYSGGAERQLVGLSTLLKEKGYNVKVITYYNSPFYKEYLDNNNITNEVICDGGNKILRILKVNKAIKDYKADVVISYLDIPNIIACLCKLLGGGSWKLIVSDRYTSQSLSLLQKIKLFLYKFANHIVPNSYSQKDFIIKYSPKFKEKIHVITNFLDSTYFIPAAENQSRNIIPTILSVGRVVDQKNIPRYVEALCIAKNNRASFKAKWYGNIDNDIVSECRQISNRYGYDNILEFHNAEKNILPIYQSNDIFCLPSLFEGYPNVLCEAMSCGMPVLCSRVCDNPSIMEENENGYMFNPLDINDISSAIVKILSLSSEKLKEMGTHSRKLALEKFSSDIFIDKYIQLIEK